MLCGLGIVSTSAILTRPVRLIHGASVSRAKRITEAGNSSVCRGDIPVMHVRNCRGCATPARSYSVQGLHRLVFAAAPRLTAVTRPFRSARQCSRERARTMTMVGTNLSSRGDHGDEQLDSRHYPHFPLRCDATYCLSYELYAVNNASVEAPQVSRMKLKPAGSLAEQADQIDAELQRRRSRTFPIDMFSRAPLPRWDGPPDTFMPAVEHFSPSAKRPMRRSDGLSTCSPLRSNCTSIPTVWSLSTASCAARPAL